MRAVAHPAAPVPSWPDLNDHSAEGVARRIAWLRAVWENADISEGLSHASPVLAAQVQALRDAAEPRPRDVRRATLSVARYLLRAENRATPFGLFAGVTTAALRTQARAEWGAGHSRSGQRLCGVADGDRDAAGEPPRASAAPSRGCQQHS